MQVSKNTVVSMHYILTNDKGERLDSSIKHDPLIFLSGAQNVIDGLDDALQGKEVGEKFVVSIPPKKGYGKVRRELIQKVPIEVFQGVDDIHVGMRFVAQTPNGKQPVTVIGVEDNGIVLDGNHPLAGKKLNFDIEILDVRIATAKELKHGHVHSDHF